MPRITKVVTRTGDAGETSLATGARLPKDADRIAAYGTLDELNSFLGVALAAELAPDLVEPLGRIQNELFHLGSDLSIPEADKERTPGPRIEERHVAALEEDIATLSRDLPPLANFVLPGGSAGASHLHVARTVCRRAERLVVRLGRSEEVRPVIIRYLNRLSDLLFLMARHENRAKGQAEPTWDSRA